MHSSKEINCPYCNSKATCQSDDEFKYVFVECPVCGRYNYLAFPSTIGDNMKDEIASYLYYTGTLEKHDDRRFLILLDTRRILIVSHRIVLGHIMLP